MGEMLGQPSIIGAANDHCDRIIKRRGLLNREDPEGESITISRPSGSEASAERSLVHLAAASNRLKEKMCHLRQ